MFLAFLFFSPRPPSDDISHDHATIPRPAPRAASSRVVFKTGVIISREAEWKKIRMVSLHLLPRDDCVNAARSSSSARAARFFGEGRRGEGGGSFCSLVIGHFFDRSPVIALGMLYLRSDLWGGYDRGLGSRMEIDLGSKCST